MLQVQKLYFMSMQFALQIEKNNKNEEVISSDNQQ